MTEETLNFFKQLIKRLCKENNEMKAEQATNISQEHELEATKSNITINILENVNPENANVYLERIIEHNVFLLNTITSTCAEAAKTTEVTTDMYNNWRENLHQLEISTGCDRFTIMSYDDVLAEHEKLTHEIVELKKQLENIQEDYHLKIKILKEQLEQRVEEVITVNFGLDEIKSFRNQLQPMYFKLKYKQQ